MDNEPRYSIYSGSQRHFGDHTEGKLLHKSSSLMSVPQTPGWGKPTYLEERSRRGRQDQDISRVRRTDQEIVDRAINKHHATIEAKGEVQQRLIAAEIREHKLYEQLKEMEQKYNDLKEQSRIEKEDCKKCSEKLEQENSSLLKGNKRLQERSELLEKEIEAAMERASKPPKTNPKTGTADEEALDAADDHVYSQSPYSQIHDVAEERRTASMDWEIPNQSGQQSHTADQGEKSDIHSQRKISARDRAEFVIGDDHTPNNMKTTGARNVRHATCKTVRANRNDGDDMDEEEDKEGEGDSADGNNDGETEGEAKSLLSTELEVVLVYTGESRDTNAPMNTPEAFLIATQLSSEFREALQLRFSELDQELPNWRADFLGQFGPDSAKCILHQYQGDECVQTKGYGPWAACRYCTDDGKLCLGVYNGVIVVMPLLGSMIRDTNRKDLARYQARRKSLPIVWKA